LRTGIPIDRGGVYACLVSSGLETKLDLVDGCYVTDGCFTDPLLTNDSE